MNFKEDLGYIGGNSWKVAIKNLNISQTKSNQTGVLKYVEILIFSDLFNYEIKFPT